MKFDNEKGLESGWAFLARVTGRSMQAVKSLGHRAEALVGLDTHRAAPSIPTKEIA